MTSHRIESATVRKHHSVPRLENWHTITYCVCHNTGRLKRELFSDSVSKVAGFREGCMRRSPRIFRSEGLCHQRDTRNMPQCSGLQYQGQLKNYLKYRLMRKGRETQTKGVATKWGGARCPYLTHLKPRTLTDTPACFQPSSSQTVQHGLPKLPTACCVSLAKLVRNGSLDEHFDYTFQSKPTS